MSIIRAMAWIFFERDSEFAIQKRHVSVGDAAAQLHCPALMKRRCGARSKQEAPKIAGNGSVTRLCASLCPTGHIEGLLESYRLTLRIIGALNEKGLAPVLDLHPLKGAEGHAHRCAARVSLNRSEGDIVRLGVGPRRVPLHCLKALLNLQADPVCASRPQATEKTHIGRFPDYA